MSDIDKRLAELEALTPKETTSEGAPQMSAPAEVDPTSDLGAFAHGIGQGATLGFSDELKAGLRWLDGEDYSKALNSEQELLKKIEQFHPRSFKGGDLAGSVGVGLIPGVGLVGKGAKAAIAGGAAIGGLSGVGHADEGQRLQGGMIGALMGGAAGGVTSLVSSAIKASGPLFEKAASGVFGKNAQAKTISAATKSVQKDIAAVADDLLANKRLEDEQLKTFAKGLQSELSAYMDQAKLQDTIAKDAVKSMSIADRLKEFAMPDSPMGMAKEAFQLFTRPYSYAGKKILNGAMQFTGDALPKAVNAGTTAFSSGIQAVNPAIGASAPNLYGSP